MPKLKAGVIAKPTFRPFVVLTVMALLAGVGLYLIFRTHAAAPPGDVNGDGTVNIQDLSILAANYGKTGQTLAQGDVNGDGAVNIQDLSIIASNWSKAVQTNSSAPATPAASGGTICGDSSQLTGPATAPAGAVTVPAGNNSSMNYSANKTYYFATGVHTVGTGDFGQIQPANGDTFIGAPGAIIDGQHQNQSAFVQPASNVTIEYLTIRNFAGTQDQFIVNHDSGPGWNITHNTIGPNDDGAALGLGDNEQITYNCVTSNGQYGINGYNAHTSGGPTPGVVIDHNEFGDNDSHNYDNPQFKNDPDPLKRDPQDCGCAGGLKLWADVNTKVTHNYIHGNHDPGIWADTLNIGVDIENNYISGNWSEGVFYEVSYNAKIVNNSFVDNSWIKGPNNRGFPTGAIYVSESGWDSRVNGGSGFTDQEIAGNVFTDNWGGVVLWENSNRYCSNGMPTDQCTLVGPSTYTSWAGPKNPNSDGKGGTCGYLTTQVVPAPDPSAGKQGVEPNYNCRWRSQNNNVHDNTFNLTPSHITAKLPCNAANHCGQNAIISNYSSVNYWKADTIPYAITWDQNNHFDNNTYTGPWIFDVGEQSDGFVHFSSWQKTVGTNNPANVNTEDHPAQDAHSTCTGCL